MAAAALTGHSQAGAQAPAPTPVFKAEVFAVPIAIWVKHPGGKPDTGLAIADFTIILDGKVRPLVEVREEADAPGHYLLNFEPPDEVRDGKNHRIEIKVKGHPSVKRTLKVPKRAVAQPS